VPDSVGFSGARVGTGRPITPPPEAVAAVGRWLAGNPSYGARPVSWLLGADGRETVVTTDSGRTVRFGFGEGALSGVAAPASPAAPIPVKQPSIETVVSQSGTLPTKQPLSDFPSSGLTARCRSRRCPLAGRTIGAAAVAASPAVSVTAGGAAPAVAVLAPAASSPAAASPLLIAGLVVLAVLFLAR
jgi:hypothetical protein